MPPSIRSLVASSLSFVIDVDGGSAAYVVLPRVRRVDVAPPRVEIRPRPHRRRLGSSTSTSATTTATTTHAASSRSSSDYLDAPGSADRDDARDDDDGLVTIPGGRRRGDVPIGPPYPNDDVRPYVRIRKRGRHYDVQTAITTFRRYDAASSDDVDEDAVSPIVTTVDLHAQVHFGDVSYYRYFDDDVAFGSRYDGVLYELIVDGRFLEPTSYPANNADATSAGGGARILRRLIPAPSPQGRDVNPIAPTPADRSIASQYGLQCQVDGMPYTKEGWIHADLTREEFLAYLDRDLGVGREGRRRQRQPQQQPRPLWALASASSASYPGSELVSSLLRPLTTTATDGSAALTRRLFTHLFLPGDALSGWIRAVLWLGVPSPELSIMLVDWSSLSHFDRRSRRRRSRRVIGGTADDYVGGGGVGDDNGIAPISPIAAPVLLSLISGRWGAARRLVFGQMLASGQSNADNSRNGVLIKRRNERAMDVLRALLVSLSTASSISGREGYRGVGVDDPSGLGTTSVALLYGAGHCRDLHNRLVRSEGMTPVRTEWRTAFRATAPRWGDFTNVGGWIRSRSRDVVSSLPSSMNMGDVVESMSVSTLESVAVGLVILPLYMLVGGFDWVSTIGNAEDYFRGGMYLDGIAAILFYLVKHVAMYVGIAKFVVDWGRNGDGIFDDDESA